MNHRVCAEQREGETRGSGRAQVAGATQAEGCVSVCVCVCVFTAQVGDV